MVEWKNLLMMVDKLAHGYLGLILHCLNCVFKLYLCHAGFAKKQGIS